MGADIIETISSPAECVRDYVSRFFSSVPLRLEVAPRRRIGAHVFYLAVRMDRPTPDALAEGYRPGHVGAVVILADCVRGGYAVRVIDESEGPMEADASPELLAMLSPFDGIRRPGYGPRWRDQCRADNGRNGGPAREIALPLTAARVAELYAEAGAPLAVDELAELEGLTHTALADRVQFLADYQG